MSEIVYFKVDFNFASLNNHEDC